MDGDEAADSGNEGQKDSKRYRLKDAIARTKTKLKRKDNSTTDNEYKLSDDVNEFLAAGRNSISSRPSTSEDNVESKFRNAPPIDVHARRIDDINHASPTNRKPIPPRSSVDHDRLYFSNEEPPIDLQYQYRNNGNHFNPVSHNPAFGRSSIDNGRVNYKRGGHRPADVQYNPNDRIEDDSAAGRSGPSIRASIDKVRPKFWKKKDSKQGAESNGNDDVAAFLAVGRNSTSSRPSTAENQPYISENPRSKNQLLPPLPLNGPPPSNKPIPPPQVSPRRIVVPRIDVSQSPRWPDANTVGSEQPTLLHPEQTTRSRSANSFSKGRGRARGLSVTFIEAPPDIIGEGGDEALTPPNEISKAKARARSVSPMPSKSLQTSPPVRRKPVAPYTQEDASDDFRPKPLQRIQTGFDTPPGSKSAIDREFEMSLHSASTASSSQSPLTYRPAFHAPKPLHPPVPLPRVNEVESPHTVKHAPPSNNLRSKYEEALGPFNNPFGSPFDHEADHKPQQMTPDWRATNEPPIGARAVRDDTYESMNTQAKPPGNWL